MALLICLWGTQTSLSSWGPLWIQNSPTSLQCHVSRKESGTEDPRRWLMSLAELERKGGQGRDDVGTGPPDGAPKTKLCD